MKMDLKVLSCKTWTGLIWLIMTGKSGGLLSMQ